MDDSAETRAYELLSAGRHPDDVADELVDAGMSRDEAVALVREVRNKVELDEPPRPATSDSSEQDGWSVRDGLRAVTVILAIAAIGSRLFYSFSLDPVGLLLILVPIQAVYITIKWQLSLPVQVLIIMFLLFETGANIFVGLY